MRRTLWMAIAICLFIGWTVALGQAPKTETDTTRRKKPAGSGAAGFLVPGAGGRPLPVRKTTPSPAPKSPSRQQPSGRPGGKPLFLVPGPGGARPLRPKPLPPRITPPPGTRLFYGPLLPRLPGQQPAPIFVPSVVQPTGPDMTPLTGLPGLASRSGSPLLYGVNVVWGDSGGTAGWDREGGAKARRLAQRMKDAGVTNTRIGIGWADVEKVRGKYDWSATDRFVRYVAGLGVTLICVIDVVPDWALDQSPETLQLFRDRGVENLAGVRAPDPKYYDDLGRFAYACALRYKDVIKHWEFWNEPDGMGMPFVVKDAGGKPVDIRYGGDPKIYTPLLRIFYESIKRADPTARIAVGGLQVLRTDFLAGIYANGGKPFFDAVALHPYNGENLIAFDWIDRCRELLVQNGDAQKTFWLTEWGWTTSGSSQGGISELHHARLIRESLAGMRSRPFITQASYHTLNDWRTNESDPNSLVTMGLVNYDLTPREGFRAFREMATGIAAAAPGFRRVTLLGGLPSEHEAGVRANPINVLVDASKAGAPLPPLWEGYALGSESGGTEYFETIVPRLQALNARLVRFDPFPNPDDVKIEGEGSASNPRPAASSALQIDWRYADTVTATLARAGAKPMINFATMPTALSAPVGNTRLPRDPAQWSAFIQSVVRRYNGEQKRGILYWELSNEPNTGAFTLQEWLPFYAAFARAVTAADPGARVGGPATAAFGADWLRALIDYCAQNSVPLHFLSWHAYGQSPADYARQVVEVRNYLRRYPALQNVELIVSEWNVSASPSPENDGLQAAAYALSVVEQLMSVAPVKSLFYAIKDGQNLRDPASRFGGRWGLLTFDNQPKAVYNAFLMLNRMEGARLSVGSEENTIRALAARSREKINNLVWSQPAPFSPQRPAPDTPVRLRVRGLPWSGPTRGQQWLVDNLHANAFSNSGSNELERVADFQAPGGDVEIPMVLSPYSATLVELTPAPAPSLSVSLETPRYVIYGGSRFVLVANLRNVSGRPQSVTALLKSSDPLLVSAESSRIGPTTIRPGETRTVRYSLRGPIGRIDGQRFFQVTAGDGVDSVAVKFASPLAARLVSQRVDLRHSSATPDSGPKTVPVNVALENRGEEPLSVQMTAGSLSETRALRPRSVTAAPFNVPVTAGVPGRYEVPINILLHDRLIERLTAFVGVPVPCRYAARKPRINGDLAEWSEAFPIALDSEEQVKEKRWGGLNDLSAQAFTLWDEQYFYIAVVVTDNTHFQLFSPENLWRGDSVQFALDTRRDAVLNQAGYDANDYEFGMSTGRLRPVLYRFAGGGLPGPVPAAEIAIERVGSRTIYEAAIPWTQLSPLRPRPNTIFGFSLLVNDSDGQERGYIEWAGGIGAEKRPGQFIGMQLIR